MYDQNLNQDAGESPEDPQLEDRAEEKRVGVSQNEEATPVELERDPSEAKSDQEREHLEKIERAHQPPERLANDTEDDGPLEGSGYS